MVAFRQRHHPETGVRGKEARSVLCSVCVCESRVQRRVDPRRIIIIIVTFFFIIIIIVELHSRGCFFFF